MSTNTTNRISLRNILNEILNETDSSPIAIMKTKAITGNFKSQLKQNRGFVFDKSERETIISKQSKLGVKPLIENNNTEIRISKSDEFNNTTVNVIKKLKNLSDPTTIVYVAFTVTQTISPDSENPPTSEKIMIRLSQPFVDTDVNGKIKLLADFIDQLHI